MPSYGDFHKDSKDLLTKNYADKGAWKVESKQKGPEQVAIFNPTAASGKPLSMDVEWNAKPFKTKTNFTEGGLVKPKVTWEGKPHKVEGSFSYGMKDGKTDFDASYEFKNSQVVSSVKYTNGKGDVEAAGSFNVGQGISVGSKVVYNLNKPDVANAWDAGVHYVCPGAFVASFTTAALKKWNFGVQYPVTISGTKINTAFALDNKFNWTLGGEGACFNCPGAKLRMRINQDFTTGLSWIAKGPSGWKVAVAGDLTKDMKFTWGTTFTLE